MEKDKKQVEKQTVVQSEMEEQQKGNKQMLGFEDVNFEQQREPYHPKNTYSNRNPGENLERRSGRRN